MKKISLIIINLLLINICLADRIETEKITFTNEITFDGPLFGNEITDIKYDITQRVNVTNLLYLMSLTNITEVVLTNAWSWDRIDDNNIRLFVNTNHEMESITGLQTALDAKVDTNAPIYLMSLTNITEVVLTNAWSWDRIDDNNIRLFVNTNHEMESITGLQTALDAKVNTNEPAYLMGLTNITEVVLTNAWSWDRIDDRNIRLYVNTNHEMESITGLQTALDAKVDTNAPIYLMSLTNITEVVMTNAWSWDRIDDHNIRLFVDTNDFGIGSVDWGNIGGDPTNQADMMLLFDSKINTNDPIYLMSLTSITEVVMTNAWSWDRIDDHNIRLFINTNHEMESITGLQTALDAKVDTNAPIYLSSLTNITEVILTNAWSWDRIDDHNIRLYVDTNSFGGAGTITNMISSDGSIEWKNSGGPQPDGSITNYLDTKGYVSNSLSVYAGTNVQLRVVGDDGYIDAIPPDGLFYLSGTRRIAVTNDNFVLQMYSGAAWSNAVIFTP